MKLTKALGLSMALSMSFALFSTKTWAAIDNQELTTEKRDLLANVNPQIESAQKDVDYEIHVLTPEEAVAYMQEHKISEELLAGVEVQAANGPLDFLSDIFGQNQTTNSYARGGRLGRRGARQEYAHRGYGGSCEARSGIASYYGPGFAGRRTASGSIFNPSSFTAAHRTLRFGTRVRVTHGGRSVVVTITDRGPFVAGRVIDLSTAAARALGISTGFVSLQILNCG